MKNFYLNLRLSGKIMLLVYGSILCLFSIWTIVLIKAADSNARDDLIQNSQDTLSYLSLSISKEQNYLLATANSFESDEYIQKALKYPEMYQDFSDQLTDSLLPVINKKQLLSLSLYDLNGTCVYCNSIDGSHSPVALDYNGADQHLQELLRQERRFYWEYMPQKSGRLMERENSPKICLWYLIRDTSNYQSIGLIALTLDSRKLFARDASSSSIIDSIILLDEKGSCVITDSKCQSLETPASFGSTLESQTLSYSKNGCFTVNINDDPYIAVYQRILGCDFVLYALIRERFSFWDTQPLSSVSIIGMFFCLLLLFPLLALISLSITKPVQNLNVIMEQYLKDNTPKKVNFKYHDEIGRLGRCFQLIMKKDSELTRKAYLSGIKQSIAELELAQAQINPHFLYNTLHIIQMEALSKNEVGIADLTYSLGKCFQYILNKGNQLICLSDEFAFLNFYLKLQVRRFPNRLTYDISFSDEILTYSIPLLILQPLIENSIVHGGKDSHTQIHISITGTFSEDGKFLKFVVADDGCGIPPEILSKLPA